MIRLPIEKSHRAMMSAICIGLFTTPLMLAGINVILPEIGADFHTGASDLSLVGSGYGLGQAVFQLSAGSLGDIYGHRRIFLTGSIIFAVGCALAGLAPFFRLFLILRILQGAGAALLSASGLALLAANAPSGQRPVYLGFSSSAVYAGIACGPPVAGIITTFINWRFLFWINTAACCLIWWMMKISPAKDWQPDRLKRYDTSGAILYAFSMASLTIFAAFLGSHKIVAFAGAFLCFVFSLLFYLREKNCTFPVLNLELLVTNRVFFLSILTALINYSSFFGLVFYFSFYLQIGKGFTPGVTGLILAVQALAMTFSTPLATHLCKIAGFGKAAALGAFLCGAGLLTSSLIHIDSSLWLFFLIEIMLGSGISIFGLSNTAIILESAGDNLGQASALTGAARSTGQLCSMILITATLSIMLGDTTVSPEEMPGFMRCMRINLIFFGILNMAAIACSLLRSRQ